MSPHPPRYSPIDKYGKYRRLAKRKAEAAGSEDVQKQVG
jgi:rRNA maturation protein Nop10